MYRFDGNLASLGFLRYDVTNLAYAIPNLKTGAVIGVGGGRDVLSQRLFGVSDVTGIEINPIIIDRPEAPLFRLHGDRDIGWGEVRSRRGTQLVCTHTALLRCHPDEPDRYLGGDRRRRLHAHGEWSLHGRGLATLSRSA